MSHLRVLPDALAVGQWWRWEDREQGGLCGHMPFQIAHLSTHRCWVRLAWSRSTYAFDREEVLKGAVPVLSDPEKDDLTT